MDSSREYPERPIPGVGTVVLRNSRGKTEVLLIRRKSEPMIGCWSLPGGAIELGETFREACVRETFEETGIRVRPLAEIETVDIILRDLDGRVQYHYLVVDVLCQVEGGKLKSGSDANEAAWGDVRQVLDFGDFALAARACTVIRKACIMSEGLE